MEVESTEREARRRSVVRAVFGRPGSFRRWLLGMLVFIAGAAWLFSHSERIGKIAVFTVSAAVIMASYWGRSLLVGDEDELRSWLRRVRRRQLQPISPEESAPVIDDESWNALLMEQSHGDAPPPPILDDDDPTPTPPCMPTPPSTSDESV